MSVGHSSTYIDPEKIRLNELKSFNIWDSGTDSEFDNLAKLAAQICDVPIAFINFINENEQWTKAHFGIELNKIPREQSFCNTTIRNNSFFSVQDAQEDECFKELDVVKNAPGIRFYAGVNVTSNDQNLGAICVLDTVPKVLNDAQKNALEILAREVETKLELRRRNIELDTVSRFLESSVDLMIVANASNLKIEKHCQKVATLLSAQDQETEVHSLYKLIKDVSLLTTLREWNQGTSVKTLNVETVFKNEQNELIEVSLSIYRDGNKFYISGRDITQKKQYQNMLESSLEEKNVLLGEIHHRVKNNLAVVSSFLQLEEFKSDNPAVKSSLFSNYMRVKSIALIHEQLYKVADFNSVIFDQYIHNMVKTIRDKRADKSGHIALNYMADNVLLNINQAIPCALILNELVSNAYEYAFENRSQGSINITLSQINDIVKLTVEDDGKGLPKEFDFEKSPTLGATLFSSYSDQLEAEVNIENRRGSKFELSFRTSRKSKGSSSNISIAV